MSEPVYTTLQQIVDQLEYCGYESKDGLHRLEDNIAFIALKERAAAEGISMQDAARRAIRDYIARSEHRSRVSTATELILDVHADAIERLGT